MLGCAFSLLFMYQTAYVLTVLCEHWKSVVTVMLVYLYSKWDHWEPVSKLQQSAAIVADWDWTECLWSVEDDGICSI